MPQRRVWHEGWWAGARACPSPNFGPRPAGMAATLGIELEGLEGGCFEAAQYHTLVGLLQVLSRRYRIGEVVGHEHVAPGRKADPGPGLDWTRLARACAGAGPHAPVIGVREA